MLLALGSALPAIVWQKDESRLSFKKSFNVLKYFGASYLPNTGGELVLDNILGSFLGQLGNSHVMLRGDADHKPIPRKVYQQDSQIRTGIKPRALVMSKCFRDSTFFSCSSALN